MTGPRTVFENEYLREHVSLGYAVTVHSAQGVTADTTHAVLGENATRSLLYVAMTRGRDTNIAHLYERSVEEEYGQRPAGPTHVPQRGTSSQAGELIRAIIANHDDRPVTAHDYAAHTPTQPYPTASDHFSTAEPQPPTNDGQPTRPGEPKQTLTHSP